MSRSPRPAQTDAGTGVLEHERQERAELGGDTPRAVEASAETAIAVGARLTAVLEGLRTRAETHHEAYRELVASLPELVLSGKRIRSTLFLAVLRELAGDDAIDDDAIDVAAALELLHAALVVHDDVIDHDTVRRGALNVSGLASTHARRSGAGPTQAEHVGDASAILAGDLLLTATLTLLAGIDADRSTRRALLTLAEHTLFDSAAGEHADVWFGAGLETADAARVLRTAELKTARYSFEAPVVAAALLAGAGPKLTESLRRVARRLGIVYQLRDDVLGVFGDPELTGKSTLADLREGTQTLLVAHARDSTQWRAAAHHFGDPELDADGAEHLRAAMRDSGALERAEATIRSEREHAATRIRSLDAGEGLETYLLTLLARCAERTS